MIQTFKALLDLLGWKRTFFLIGLMLLSALVDVLGVASILPFMAVVADPMLVQESPALVALGSSFGIFNEREFLLAIGLAVFLVFTSSLVLKGFTLYSQFKYVHGQEFVISKRFFKHFLYKDYSFFLQENPDHLSKNVVTEVSVFANEGLLPLCSFISHLFLCSFLITLLLIIDVSLAISVGSLFGGFYFLLHRFSHKELGRIGSERFDSNELRYQGVQEAFRGIKCVKFLGLEQYYIQRLSKSAERYSEQQSRANIITQIPRYGIEGFAFGGMLVLLLYLLNGGQPFTELLPTLSLYALAGYRLMPAIQHLYASACQLKYIARTTRMLLSHMDSQADTMCNQQVLSAQPWCSFERIEFEDISFRYPAAIDDAVRGLFLELRSGDVVGFVGPSGSGKTTFVDVMLGLLPHQSGDILIDGLSVKGDVFSGWNKSIGYVPQENFLIDGSIAANIALGVDQDNIDWGKLKSISETAGVTKFLKANGMTLETEIGDAGKRLSGGQRQRIGIARALYKGGHTLILDEATSALDALTETQVLEALVQKKPRKQIIIIIAHRYSALKFCKKIYAFKKGRIIDSGSFEWLNECTTDYIYEDK